MSILEKGQVVENSWTILEDDATSFPEGDIIVSSSQLERALGRNAKGRIGVSIRPDEDISSIRGYLDKLSVVSLNFPAFNDGRAFSQARYLRETCHYKGNIRVTGTPLPDQYVFLRRCGVDQVELSSGEMKEKWKDVPQYFSQAYQPSVMDEKYEGPLFRRWLDKSLCSPDGSR